MNWKAKGILQGGLALLPCGSQCNYLLQRTVGTLRSDLRVTDVFFEDVTVLFERIARLNPEPRISRLLEIGTGHLPVFPLCLALAGFRNIFTGDITRHLRASAVRRTLQALEKHLDHPAFRHFATQEQVYENYHRLMRADSILSAAGITYLAPFNAAATQWPAESMDLIASNNVFEHVPVPGLVAMFAEAKRLLRPGGHVLHCVNCGDHYAYSDNSISQLNYLQFSETQWNRWNNSLQYQNRLRPIDFIEMADNGGLQIESAEYGPKPEYLEQLKNMEIAPEFRHYSLEQLASTSLTLIARS